MRVRVHLYGTLSQQVPAYQHSQGIEIEIPDGATVDDLLASLEISKSQKVVITIDGRVQKENDRIPCSAHVQVFQPMHGG